jgi:hypothetical protein
VRWRDKGYERDGILGCDRRSREERRAMEMRIMIPDIAMSYWMAARCGFIGAFERIMHSYYNRLPVCLLLSLYLTLEV